MNVKLPVADSWFADGELVTAHVCPDGQLSVVEAPVVVSVTVIELPLSEPEPTASIVYDKLVELVAFT